LKDTYPPCGHRLIQRTGAAGHHGIAEAITRIPGVCDINVHCPIAMGVIKNHAVYTITFHACREGDFAPIEGCRVLHDPAEINVVNGRRRRLRLRLRRKKQQR
jgi:hypothetical protein